MKKALILSAVMAFIAATTNVQAADCSNYKTFSHKWNMCKVGKLPGIESPDTEVETKSGINTSWIKKFFNKIRTFGGKNVGSEG